MGSFRNKISFEISASFCLAGALALLILPLKWLIAAFIAAVIHEVFHVVAVILCGSKVCRIKIGAFGAVIDVSPMSSGRELICALAGPFGGLLLLIFAKRIPMIALCTAFQSIYNLLPVYPMDGGRALRCATAILLPPPAADKVCLWAERGARALLLCIGLYGCWVLGMGLLPLFFAILPAVSRKKEKSLANKTCKGYNSPTIAKRYDYDGFTKPDSPNRAETCPVYGWRV